MRTVAVYTTDRQDVRIVPENVTDVGVGIASDHVITLDRPSDDDLGRAVLQAITEAGRSVRHPADQAAFRVASEDFVRAMGFRSHRQLMRSCRLVVVQEEGDGVVAIPTDNEGTRGGYRHRPDDAFRIGADAPDQVGAAVRAALALSTDQHVTFTDAD
jgi:hypothetical protein